MLTNLLGEYDVSLDSKGRFLLPAGLRKQLPKGDAERFVINRGFESCLTMYPMETWTVMAEKVNRLNDFNPKVREFKRLFMNGATIVEVDSAGRMLLSKSLQEYAGMSKDVIMSAQGNKIELWNKDTYFNYVKDKAAGFSDLAAEVAGGDFMNPFDIV
jgi:MraZ protein